MKHFPLLILAMSCISAIPTALACSETPQAQIVPAKELIKRTKTIVLAKVEKAEILGKESIDVRYYFREIRSLKGDAPETFTIDGISLAYSGSLDHFGHHYSDDFWKDGGGRSWHDTDCVIHPSFAVGGIILIFLEVPFHKKSFECIIRTHGGEGVRDKWLTWVVEQTKTEQDGGGKPTTCPESK